MSCQCEVEGKSPVVFLTSSHYRTESVPGPVTPAQYGEFGHVVSLRREERHVCDGSLISPTAILTTATCCLAGLTVARLGDYTDSTDLYEQDLAVGQTIVHEAYDDWTIQNDICMVRLEQPADTSSQFVATIPLPSDDTDYLPGQTCQE